MSDASNVKPARPVYRNIGLSSILFTYRLPLAGRVSILHRASGMLLFLALPFLLYLFEQSLVSVSTFETFRELISHWLVKLVLLVLLWGYLHHFAAGVRHLLMDLHIGVDKDAGRRSALVVLVISLALTLVLGLKLYGVF